MDKQAKILCTVACIKTISLDRRVMRFALSHLHTSLNKAHYLSGMTMIIMMMMIMRLTEKESKKRRGKWTNIDPCRCVRARRREEKFEMCTSKTYLFRFFTAYICLNIIFILCLLIQLRITDDHKNERKGERETSVSYLRYLSIYISASCE